MALESEPKHVISEWRLTFGKKKWHKGFISFYSFKQEKSTHGASKILMENSQTFWPEES